MDNSSFIFNFKKLPIAGLLTLGLVGISIPFVMGIHQRYRDRIYHYGDIVNRVNRHSATVQVLIVGASDARRIQTNYFKSSAMNVAFENEDYMESYFKLQRLLIKTPHLKTLILAFNRSSFSSSWQTNYGMNKEYFLFGEFGLDGYVESLSRHGLVFFEKMAKTLNIVNLQSLEDDLTAMESHAREKQISDWNHEKVRRNAQIYADLHFQDARPYDKLMIEYFLKIVNLCKEKGISLVLVSTPVTREYYSAIQKYVPDSRHRLFCRELISHHQEVGWEDYSALYFDRPELFGDAIHLNEKGAKEFSLKLATDLERYL